MLGYPYNGENCTDDITYSQTVRFAFAIGGFHMKSLELKLESY